MYRYMRYRLYGNIAALRSNNRNSLHLLKNSSFSLRNSRQIYGLNNPHTSAERHQYQAEDASIVQTVRLKERRKGPISILCFIVTGIICKTIYSSFILEPLGQALDEVEIPEVPEEELHALFFPFPLTTREIKQPPYGGNDPEWQEFIRFSKQPNLAKKIRRELADMILQAAVKNPIIPMHVGKEMKLRRYWLDIDFPPNPPPEYIHSGIEIGNDYIAWTSHPVDSMTVRKIQRALWPSTMMLSTWNFTKAVVVNCATRLLGLITHKTDSPPSLDEILARYHQLINDPRIPRHDKSTTETHPYSGEAGISTSPSLQQASMLRKDEEDESEKGNQSALLELHQHFSRPIDVFQKTLFQSWKRPISYPPRGSFSVSGLIEIDTPKAFLVLDVNAFWDPQSRSYDLDSLTVEARRIQLKRQTPGGKK